MNEVKAILADDHPFFEDRLKIKEFLGQTESCLDAQLEKATFYLSDEAQADDDAMNHLVEELSGGIW